MGSAVVVQDNSFCWAVGVTCNSQSVCKIRVICWPDELLSGYEEEVS